jgi:hypothetical protein
MGSQRLARTGAPPRIPTTGRRSECGGVVAAMTLRVGLVGTATPSSNSPRTDHRLHGIHLAQRERRPLHRPDRRPLRHLRTRVVSPVPPADCGFDYGQGVSLSPGENATFVCPGDTALGDGQPLAYGGSISAGFWCVTARSRASRAATRRRGTASRSLARPIGCSDPLATPHGGDLCRLARVDYCFPSRRATISPVACGCSAVGSASPCQGEGRGFESRHPLEGASGINPDGGVAEW